MLETFLHFLIETWFSWVRDGGYWAIFLLMALESTIVPIPSELIIPPAAFWAAQGQMNFWGVVLAATLGSYFGSAVSYGICYFYGLPFVKKYGHIFRLKPDQLLATQKIIQNYGAPGVFIARLLPVVRHLISLPAGIFRMRFSTFSFVTITGAATWCYILSLWGAKVIGSRPELIESPEKMTQVIRDEMLGLILGILFVAALYIGFVIFQRRHKLTDK